MILAGLVLLTVLGQFISLFLPLGWQAHLLIWAVAVGLLLTRRIKLPKFNRPIAWLPSILLFLTLLVILENATHRPNNPDTNLYHAQAIRWIEQYPAVPGLGNLHGRLAFNSAWLAANALFSFSFLGTQSFHLLGSFIFLIACLVFWQGWVALAAGRWTVSATLKAFFLPLAFGFLGAEISSPGTDLPASLLIWLVTILYVEWTETEQTYHTPLILLLTALAITIKLSAVPLAFLALIPLSAVWLMGQERRALALAAGGVVVALPFLARNLVLSGYLLYPFSALDWFSFDWKVPLERVQAEQQAIISWGRAAANSASAPLSTWFPLWFSYQTLIRRLLLFLTLASPLLAIFSRFSPRKLWQGWLALYLGVCLWFLSAPDYRFGYGLLAANLGLAVATGFSGLFGRFSGLAKLAVPFAQALLTAFLGLTLVRSFEVRTFSSRWLLPSDYARVVTEPCGLANGEIFCAQAYGACGYRDFPCAPTPRPWVELRGSGWQDGFRSLSTNP